MNSKLSIENAIGRIRFLNAMLAVSKLETVGKISPYFEIRASISKKPKTKMGGNINLIVNLPFKSDSSPKAEIVTKEKVSKNMILEGCIDEINGKL